VPARIAVVEDGLAEDQPGKDSGYAETGERISPDANTACPAL
jgi:hypothetical protein